MNHSVSAIIPTIGRPDSLRRLLDSLAQQTTPLHEIIVADASAGTATANLLANPAWVTTSPVRTPESESRPVGTASHSLHPPSAPMVGTPSPASHSFYPPAIHRVAVHPPNAVRQRQAAIAAATGSCLLLLDDDVVLEPDCVEQLLAMLRSHPDAVAAVADFTNQPWPGPTRLWRFYLRRVLGLPEGAWQGRVVGPLLRFGYNPSPTHPMPMEWLGAGNSMVLHSAYERAGGFSNFFLHRCAMNEDVDLGLKLSRLGRIYLCPAARMRHEQAPGGRARATAINEDDLYNRYLVLHHTLGKSKLRALALVLAFFAVETLSNTYNSVARLDPKLVLLPLLGRARAIFRITALLATAARK